MATVFVGKILLVSEASKNKHTTSTLKLSAFPKCYIDQIVGRRSMSEDGRAEVEMFTALYRSDREGRPVTPGKGTEG